MTEPCASHAVGELTVGQASEASPRGCIGKRKINLSQIFAGQILGITEVDDQIWLVSFLGYDLGFFDANEGCVEPAPNPFAPEQV